MRKLALIIVASLAMTGCQTTAGTVHDAYTGQTVQHSKRYSIGGGLLANAHATVMHSEANGYRVGVEYLATGGSWNFFKEAWSDGTRYPFDPYSSDVLGCGGGCTLSENGYIRMTPEQFKKAAQSGFAFRLAGTGGAFEGNVPAAAFQEVLNEQTK